MACAEFAQVGRRYFFKKLAIPGLFFVYFRLFKQTLLQFFTTNKCEKCPSSKWCWDSNPRPSGHESPTITTRPGLQPKLALKFSSNKRSLEKCAIPGIFFIYFRLGIQLVTVMLNISVAMAQLTARSLPIQEDQGSNPVIENFYRTII